MKTYYFLDPNGSFTSEDGQTRYTAFNGRKAYEFLKSYEGKKRRVVKISHEEDPDEVFMEVAEDLIPYARQGERREQYVDDNKRDAGFMELSLDAPVGEEVSEDEITLLEMVPNGDESVEEQCEQTIEIEQLREALALLNKAELALINALYLQKRPFTQSEYAEIRGVSQVAVYKRKNAALKKIKKFFE